MYVVAFGWCVLTAMAVDTHLVSTILPNMIQKHLAALDASKLEVHLTTSSRPIPDHNSPEQWSQSYPTDHMLTATWSAATGWSNPKLGPTSDITLSPLALALHYAVSCFEGLKCYRGYDGKARLFRPLLNAQRMLQSAERLCLPSFEPAELEALLIRFAEVEAAKWCPVSRPGTFFYIRPVMLASQGALGLQSTREALLYIVATSFPNIDDTPVTAPPTTDTPAANKENHVFLKTTDSASPGLKLWAEPGRAWPGGAGAAKVASNYGPTLITSEQARSQGYDQVLWLYSGSGYEKNPLVLEAGGSNFFTVWKTSEGKTQLITTGLEKGVILPGITRRSILEFARSQYEGELEVVEGDYGVEDVMTASKEGRLLEAFAAGCAYFVTPVKQITYKGQDAKIPVSDGNGGKYTKAIREFLQSVKYGKIDHEWGAVLNEA